MSTPGSNEISNWEYDPTIKAKRVMIAGSSLQTIVDESGAPATTYVGKAPAGLETSATGWLLEKIVVSGTTTTISHANDSWDQRAGTASYS